MSKYKRKYIKGDKITSLDELAKQEFVYFFDKITHCGWFKSWQLRFTQECIERGFLYYAERKEMSKCENCIHEGICRFLPSVAKNIECRFFKDKSLFVELPCKVGQIVYVLRSQTSNGKNLYLREERISHYRVFGDYTFMCFESERLSVAEYQWEKTVFLTKAEAEAKLKEIGARG